MPVVDDDDEEMRHRLTELDKWRYRLMTDPDYYEKERYIDTINEYSNLIEEYQKLYEQTPVTDRYKRARIQNGLKATESSLAETRAEYEKFKKDKARTGISK